MLIIVSVIRLGLTSQNSTLNLVQNDQTCTLQGVVRFQYDD